MRCACVANGCSMAQSPAVVTSDCARYGVAGFVGAPNVSHPSAGLNRYTPPYRLIRSSSVIAAPSFRVRKTENGASKCGKTGLKNTEIFGVGK